MVVEIPLIGASSKAEVLHSIGQLLELGGPDGNHPVEVTGSGWGLNWDALFDSLKELQSGGIWGTSRKFAFPLRLRITGWQAFKIDHPDDFETLVSVLRDTASHYSHQNTDFQYEFA